MADIVIRMEIPKTCVRCRLVREKLCQYYCPLQTEEQNESALALPDLYKNCPLNLGALPEGHGRLIDEADFLKRLDEYAENVYSSKTDDESVIEAQSGNNISDNEKYILQGLFEAREILEDRAETVLEAEVKEDGNVSKT